MLVSLGALVQWEEVLYYARHAQKYHDLTDHTRQSKRTVELARKYLAVLVQSWVRRAIATPGASAAPVVLFRCRSWCWDFGAR